MARSKPDRLGRTFRARATASGVLDTRYTRGGWGAKWRIASDVAPSFDAVALVDHISDVVMAEHWHAIGEGRRAGDMEAQPKLATWGRAGRDAAEGRRPNVRGFTASTAKPFRDNIERTAVKISGKKLQRSRLVAGTRALKGQTFRANETVEATRAKTTIRPDRIHESFMALELERGNDFFFVTGGVADAVDKALAAYTNIALDGALKAGDRRELKAKKARTR
jgi:hypothetical protein